MGGRCRVRLVALVLLVVACGEDADRDGFSVEAGDCDDSRAEIRPSAREVCNGLDDDCDGVVDGPEAAGATYWRPDRDGDGFGAADESVWSCAAPDGWVATGGDCDDGDAAIWPGAVERCDGADTDCDGTVDEADAADAPDWYYDGDGDGFGVGGPVRSCARPEGHAAASGDCDDTSAAVFPGAVERCNRRDDDCDGTADEADAADALDWWVDADDDGWGVGVPVRACAQPAGHAATPGDCDDDRDDVNPGAPEVCGGADEDCDGVFDVGAIDAIAQYVDMDVDGYGDGGRPALACPHTAGVALNGDDCDDRRDDVFPGADEVCDGADNDCDAAIDEQVAQRFYVDVDGDGFGVEALPVDACAQPDGTALVAGDCHDQDPSIAPDADEVCNGVDDDCDGAADDADDGLDLATATEWRVDADGDGFGAGDPVLACVAPPGHVAGPVDCNDDDPAIDPASACDWAATFVLPGPADLFLVAERDAAVVVDCDGEVVDVALSAGDVGTLSAGPGACTVIAEARTVIQAVSSEPGGDRLSVGRALDGLFGGTEVFVWSDGVLTVPPVGDAPRYARWTDAGWVDDAPASDGGTVGGPALWRVRSDDPLTATGWRVATAERHFAWVPSRDGLLVGEAFDCLAPPVVYGEPALVIHCVDDGPCVVTAHPDGEPDLVLPAMGSGEATVWPVGEASRVQLTSQGQITVRAESTPRGFLSTDGSSTDTALVPGLGGTDLDTAFRFVAALGRTTRPELVDRRSDVWVLGHVDGTVVTVRDLGSGAADPILWRVDAGQAVRVVVDAAPGTPFQIDASDVIAVQLVHGAAPFAISAHTGFFRDR